MPRKREGSVIWEIDHFVARVLLDNGKYGRVHLEPGLTEAKAKENAAFYAENLDKALDKITAQKNQKAGVALIPKGETFTHFLTRYFEDRDRRGMSSIDSDRRMLDNYACPHIGDKPIGDDGIQREDIEKLVQHLDEKTARGDWSWRTAQRVWHVLCALFRCACSAKTPALRVRKTNPLADVAPPDTGEEKAKAFIWPNEFLQLMTCEQIPLAARRLYALTIYLYSRASEVLLLRWTDLDLEHQTITICRGWDHTRHCEKSTKAGRTRFFAIEPHLIPLLRAMYAERKDNHVFPHRQGIKFESVLNGLAVRFREHLQRAGITRADLFLADDQHLQIRFHDGRASAITWAALRGDHVTTIMERVGHVDYATTQKYLRRADALRGRIGDPFPALPSCLLGSWNLSGNLSGIYPARSQMPSFQGFSAMAQGVTS